MVYVTSKIAATNFSKTAICCESVHNRHLIGGVESVNFQVKTINSTFKAYGTELKKINSILFPWKELFTSQLKILTSTFCLNADNYFCHV